MEIAKIFSILDEEKAPQNCAKCSHDMFGIVEQSSMAITGKCVNCGEVLTVEGKFEIEKI